MISIRRQLTRRLLGAVLLILVGGLAALYFGAREAATDQFDRTVQAKALAVSTLTFQTADGFRFEFTDRFLRGFDDRAPSDFFQLWDADGREIARSESMPTGANLARRTGTITHPAEWNLALPNGRAGRATGFTFRPKVADPSLRGKEKELQLVVASDRDDLDETLWGLLAFSGAWALLLIGATLWVVPRVLRNGLRPLDELGERATRIDADSLSTRFALDGLPPELRPIAQRLNDLFGRLEQSFERERRFSADLAHELRTPLAELRSMAECALKWPDSRDPANDRETLAIAQQMEGIVTHILALVRAEQGQLAAKSEPIAVTRLVRDVWQRFAGRAGERRLNVSLHLDDLDGIGDPALLRSILTNLCTNAVDYSPEAGDIVIMTERQSDRAVVTIANTTSDLGPEDLPKLFDRFWRKEAARSGGLHVGLGLSLSRTFARAIGWDLSAAFDAQKRLAFRLAGPAGSTDRKNVTSPATTVVNVS